MYKIQAKTTDLYAQKDKFMLNHTWNNLDVVKENMRRLRDHYDVFGYIHEYQTDDLSIHLLHKIQSFTDKPWFYLVEENFLPKTRNSKSNEIVEYKKQYSKSAKTVLLPSIYQAARHINLLDDSGNTFIHDVSWGCIYYASVYLNQLKIVEDDWQMDF